MLTDIFIENTQIAQMFYTSECFSIKVLFFVSFLFILKTLVITLFSNSEPSLAYSFIVF